MPKVPWIFASSRTGNPFSDIRDAWGEVGDLVGLRNFRLHDLRHTFASHAVMSRESLPMIGKLLGYRCIKCTARYARLDDAHLIDAVEEIGRAIEQAFAGGRQTCTAP